MTLNYPTSQTISSGIRQIPAEEWHVLVLFADDTEKDIKGIWGPYSSMDIATVALDELRQWPLDGYWDVRRLNKFVARKAANTDELMRFSWQS